MGSPVVILQAVRARKRGLLTFIAHTATTSKRADAMQPTPPAENAGLNREAWTMTNQSAAVAEYREASAACRRAFAAHAEAREAQILANRRYSETSEALLAAQDRLDRADQGLQEAKAEAPTPADIDAPRGVTGGAGMAQGQLANGSAPVTHAPEPGEMGIG